MIAHYLCPNGHETVVSPISCKEPLTVECGDCSGGVVVTAKLIGAEDSQRCQTKIDEFIEKLENIAAKWMREYRRIRLPVLKQCADEVKGAIARHKEVRSR